MRRSAAGRGQAGQSTKSSSNLLLCLPSFPYPPWPNPFLPPTLFFPPTPFPPTPFCPHLWNSDIFFSPVNRFQMVMRPS